jgi:torulene dioxygenase
MTMKISSFLRSTRRIKADHIGRRKYYVTKLCKYGVDVEKMGYLSDSLIKIHTKKWDVKVWVPKTNHMPSDPVFVARPGGTKADDGIPLTVALDARRKLSSLVILNAQTMKEVGRAK